ncbi:MAG: hypothetical protein M0R46_11460 [Candidatus Muirbacterium halophilum]|nr:hypothetical protein [Candidatus Muirbacterium halophilum]
MKGKWTWASDKEHININTGVGTIKFTKSDFDKIQSELLKKQREKKIKRILNEE